MLFQMARTVPWEKHPALTELAAPMCTLHVCFIEVRRLAISATLVAALIASVVPADAGQGRARLSRDLSDRLAARVEGSTDVIVEPEM